MLYDGEVQKFDYQFNIIIINQIMIKFIYITEIIGYYYDMIWYDTIISYYFLKEIDILQRRPGYTEAIIY